MHTVQVEWSRNEQGPFIPKNVPGTEKVAPAQLVLLAMGFLGPEQPLREALGVERDARSHVKRGPRQPCDENPRPFRRG